MDFWSLFGSMGMLLSIAIAFLVAKALYGFITDPLAGSNIPKAPSGNFLLGNTLEIFRGQSLEPQQKWVQEMGPVIRYRMLTSRRALVSHPDDLHALLIQHPKKLSKRLNIPYKMIESFLGSFGLVTLRDEEIHTQQRTLVAPAFNPLKIKQMMGNLFVKAGTNLVAGMKEKVGAGPSNILNLFDGTTLEVIGEAAFSYDIKERAELDKKLGRDPPHLLFAKFMDQQSARSVLDMLPGTRGSGITAAQRKRIELLAEINKQVDEVIDNLLAKKKAGGAPEESASLLDNLLEVAMGDPNLDPGVLKDMLRSHTITFLFAGHETSSKMLSWTSYLLATNPAVQEKVYQEIRDKFPVPLSNADNLTEESRKKVSEKVGELKYLDAVIKESLRLFPPVPLVLRRVEEEVSLPHSGVTLPSQSVVVLSPFVTQRLPSVWGEDAEEYRPERWLEAETPETKNRCAFFPFLVGKRNCIGQHMAMMEVKLLMLMVIRELKLIWPEGQEHPKRQLAITMRPKGGYELILEARP